MNAVDFTNSIEKVCGYGGSEKKKKIIYNGEVYLLKFPDPIIEKSLLYKNNVFSTYIGCKIFESVNIPVQKVILGIYNEKQEKEVKQKVVVACKDFTNEKQKLIEFSSLANSITDVDKKFTTKIEDIYEVFNNLNYDFDKKLMIENFWNMFVVDTLIGNTDRHLSNFGVIDDGEALKYIDYDLDLKVWPGYRYKVLDEGEYAAHRIKYQYSDELDEIFHEQLNRLIVMTMNAT